MLTCLPDVQPPPTPWCLACFAPAKQPCPAQLLACSNGHRADSLSMIPGTVRSLQFSTENAGGCAAVAFRSRPPQACTHINLQLCSVAALQCCPATFQGSGWLVYAWQPPSPLYSSVLADALPRGFTGRVRNQPLPLSLFTTGFWLMHCHVGDHINAGMKVGQLINPLGCLPVCATRRTCRMPTARTMGHCRPPCAACLCVQPGSPACGPPTAHTKRHIIATNCTHCCVVAMIQSLCLGRLPPALRRPWYMV